MDSSNLSLHIAGGEQNGLLQTSPSTSPGESRMDSSKLSPRIAGGDAEGRGGSGDTSPWRVGIRGRTNSLVLGAWQQRTFCDCR